jgi:hypothetical protein
MSIYLTYSEVRAFAKAVREFVQQKIKHSEVLEDIASSLGMKPDAMMHFLKTAEKKRKALPLFKDMTAAEFLGKRNDPAFCESYSRWKEKLGERKLPTIPPEARKVILEGVLEARNDGKLKIDGRFVAAMASKVSKRMNVEWRPIGVGVFVGLIDKATGKGLVSLYQSMYDEEGIERPKRIIYDEFYRALDGKAAADFVKAVIPYSYVAQETLRAMGKSPEDADVVPTGGGWFRIPRGDLSAHRPEVFVSTTSCK